MGRSTWLVFAVGFGFSAATFARSGDWTIAGIIGVVGLVLVWWVSPLRASSIINPSSTTTHREAQNMSNQSVIVYWRPGCGFCSRLRSTLGKHADQAQWVNIWEDKEAAAFVRSVNDGNEVVPTVVMDGIPVTNPNPKVVLDKITA